MPRHSSNHAEAVHVSRISDQVGTGMILKITSRANPAFSVVGAVRRVAVGNNGGRRFGVHGDPHPSAWTYYGEVEVETLQREIMNIDYLDIGKAEDVFDLFRDEFVKAGVIKIVTFPEEGDANG